MTLASPTLHLMCGKIASGKSTLTAKLGASNGTIVIAEDEWLSALYPDELSSISDYMRCTARLRTIIAPHVASVLNAGVSVVLDFQANTVDARKWMRSILSQTSAAHKLHVLDTPDDICIARLRTRNASGSHPFAPTEEQFWQLSKHFVAPTSDEGFDIVRHAATGEV